MTRSIRIDTPLARIHSYAAGLVEIRMKPGVAISRQAIYDLIDGLDAHGLTAPMRLLVVIPAEGVEFQLPIMKQDHFADRPKGIEGRRMAWVIPSGLDRQLARLYMSYFPPPLASKIFAAEEDALAWLRTS